MVPVAADKHGRRRGHRGESTVLKMRNMGFTDLLRQCVSDPLRMVAFAAISCAATTAVVHDFVHRSERRIMASGIFDDALLKHLLSTDELRAIFNDRNRVQKWYDYEAALALEQAELGIIPRAAAQEIAAKAKRRRRGHRGDRGRRSGSITHPLVPALQAPCRTLCKARPRRVHPFRSHDAGRARHRHGAADEGRARDLSCAT